MLRCAVCHQDAGVGDHAVCVHQWVELERERSKLRVAEFWRARNQAPQPPEPCGFCQNDSAAQDHAECIRRSEALEQAQEGQLISSAKRFGLVPAELGRLMTPIGVLLALGQRHSLRPTQSVESTTCWFVPCNEIGVLGYVVLKADHRVFVAGSGLGQAGAFEVIGGQAWHLLGAGYVTSNR